MDIIKAITLKLPDATVNNVGENGYISGISNKNRKQLINYGFILKLRRLQLYYFLVLLLLLCRFILMQQIPKIFQNYYLYFFGEYNDMPLILAIPYTIGLGVGIILFLIIFQKIYVTKDPTPIEIGNDNI